MPITGMTTATVYAQHAAIHKAWSDHPFWYSHEIAKVVGCAQPTAAKHYPFPRWGLHFRTAQAAYAVLSMPGATLTDISRATGISAPTLTNARDAIRARNLVLPHKFRERGSKPLNPAIPPDKGEEIKVRLGGRTPDRLAEDIPSLILLAEDIPSLIAELDAVPKKAPNSQPVPEPAEDDSDTASLKRLVKLVRILGVMDHEERQAVLAYLQRKYSADI